MPMFLPVQGGKTVNENPPTEALKWELTAATAGPSGDAAIVDGPILGPHEGRVTKYRTGPGDVSIESDQWLNPDIFVVGREGVMNGEGLFRGIPDPPKEGHGDGDFAQNGPIIDHSTRSLAIFWSDWAASTALQAGGRGSFTGEHVTIVRVPPGSGQGYQPSGMEQPNNVRSLPAPWDAAIVAGGG